MMAFKLTDVQARRLLRDMMPNARERAALPKDPRPGAHMDCTVGKLCAYCRAQARLWHERRVAGDRNVSDPPALG